MTEVVQQTDSAAVNTKQGRLVVFESANGRTDWKIMSPEEVPQWLKDSDVMGRLVRGEIAQMTHAGIVGTPWYRAEEPLSDAEIGRLVGAHEKRERWAAKARTLQKG